VHCFPRFLGLATSLQLDVQLLQSLFSLVPLLLNGLLEGSLLLPYFPSHLLDEGSISLDLTRVTPIRFPSSVRIAETGAVLSEARSESRSFTVVSIVDSAFLNLNLMISSGSGFYSSSIWKKKKKMMIITRKRGRWMQFG
jgi:hypothetical protein